MIFLCTRIPSSSSHSLCLLSLNSQTTLVRSFAERNATLLSLLPSLLCLPVVLSLGLALTEVVNYVMLARRLTF